ncbi:hypothetical protein ACFO3O_03595 [Dokdonia ponticola]|uniref:Uncharacterized protein n=1 Tax=Dokdonia ponticola TaxID=2041041 RepID=A0ABV9HTZ7_9FLAO
MKELEYQGIKYMELNCKQCGTFFIGRNKRQVYCSSKCRTKACRVRHGKGKLSELIKQEPPSKSINNMDLLTASMGSVIGNTFQEVVNPKATYIAQKRIEAKQDLLIDKIENIELNQLSMSQALNCDKYNNPKATILPTLPRSIKAKKDPRIKKLVDIELKEEWIDRNFYWVAPTVIVTVLYVCYKLIPDKRQKEVA